MEDDCFEQMEEPAPQMEGFDEEEAPQMEMSIPESDGDKQSDQESCCTKNRTPIIVLTSICVVLTVIVGSTEWWIRTQPDCGAPIARWIQVVFLLTFPGLIPGIVLCGLILAPFRSCRNGLMEKAMPLYVILAYLSMMTWSLMFNSTEHYPDNNCWKYSPGNKAWIILMTVLQIAVTGISIMMMFMLIGIHRQTLREDRR